MPAKVTALIGENGAGKSTLVKILTGIYHAGRGRDLSVGGQPRHFASPRDAWAAGITAIHQETVMFDELSVAENIFMGHMPTGGRRSSTGGRCAAQAARAAGAASRRDSIAGHAAEGARRSRKSTSSRSPARCRTTRGVVIMDEPTAALSRHEIDDLFRIVAQLKAEGTRHPLHLAQVRRDLPRRRPLDRACATARRWAKG